MPAAIPIDQRPATAIDLLRRWAEQTPDAVATYHRLPSGTWTPTTWASLWSEVRRSAAVLRELGLQRGDRLAILSRTCREWVVAELAAGLAGAIVIGIDAHAAPEQIEWVLEQVSASGLVVDTPQNLANVPRWARERMTFIVMLDDQSSATEGSDVRSWRTAMSTPTGTSSAPIPTPRPDDPMTWIFTSGTSGTPKGIEYSHWQLMAAAWAMLDEFPDFDDARLVCWLPMAAMFQRMLNLVAFASRSTTYFVENPRDIMERLGEIHPTVFTSVPRFYERVHQGILASVESQPDGRKRLARAALRAGAEWSRAVRGGTPPGLILRMRHALLDRLVLRRMRQAMGGEIKWMFSGSAAAPVWLLEFFHSIGLPLLEGYATSENAVPMAANRPDDYRLGSVGKPFKMNDILFSEGGEILVKSPVMFHGYLGDVARERFTLDGYYRTGDLGHLDADGFLCLTGRVSEIIKTSAGRRISPVAVENVYGESRYVEQIMVVGDNRPHLVALVTLHSNVAASLSRPGESSPAATAEARELLNRDFETLGQRLARHERIRAFTILEEPFTVANGELTPTLKMKRPRIHVRYATMIDALYSGEEKKTTVEMAFALEGASAGGAS